MDQEEDEEESAYNEHFKNNGDKPGPGEFRVPSVRVRPQGPGVDTGPGPHQQAADYTGTKTEQGKHDSGEDNSHGGDKQAGVKQSLIEAWWKVIQWNMR